MLDMGDREGVWDQLKPRMRDVAVGAASIFGWEYLKGTAAEYMQKIQNYRCAEKIEMADEIAERLKKDYIIKPRDADE
jgi:hypothetical protein